GNDKEKKSLLTESEATLRKEIGQLDKVIQERETQVKGLTTTNSERKEKLVEAIKALRKLKVEKQKLTENSASQTTKRISNLLENYDGNSPSRHRWHPRTDSTTPPTK
ncbi:MAG: hypothetical protein ACO3N6_08520, partial [bacterium]